MLRWVTHYMGAATIQQSSQNPNLSMFTAGSNVQVHGIVNEPHQSLVIR